MHVMDARVAKACAPASFWAALLEVINHVVCPATAQLYCIETCFKGAQQCWNTLDTSIVMSQAHKLLHLTVHCTALPNVLTATWSDVLKASR